MAMAFRRRHFSGRPRRFRARGDDTLVVLLEAGALTFSVLLVTLEIRNLVAGTLANLSYGLLEQSLQSLAWLAIAYGLLVYQRRTPRPVLLWGWRILAGLASAQIVVLQLLFDNPLWSGAPVGTWPLANLLILAYGAPAAAAVFFARALRHDGAKWLAAGAGLLALVLAFSYLSLELRHVFHAPWLDRGLTTDGEWYAYSLLWLAYAGGLLAVGMLRNLAALRYASLAVVLITVAKVFLFDMSALTGLWRVASFMGLGLSLVGIGFLYQRIVFPPAGPADGRES